MAQEIPTLASVLKGSGNSVTRVRTAVFSALLGKRPMTMAVLQKKLEGEVDRVSVYRTIELFEELGIVNRIQIGWKYKLELSDLFDDHHHHATCIRCGGIITLEEDEALERGIKRLVAKTGFTITSHSLEIRGTCENCR